MATESVKPIPGLDDQVPTVEVPAQKLLDCFSGANQLSCRLEGVVGMMTILTEQMADNTPENCAMHAVKCLIEDCYARSNELQWSYADEARARRALGET